MRAPATPPSSLLPPSSNTRYKVIRELGRGGMGVVHLAHDSVRGEDVAQKRILSLDTDSVLRFKREFRVMEALQHPRLVKLHELGADDLGLFFTMELLHGQDLLAYCRGDQKAGPVTETARSAISPKAQTSTFERSLSVETEDAPPSPRRYSGSSRDALARLAGVLPQLFEALAFLHGAGIVHRDLKPNNVMVTTDGSLKLLDFGILSQLRRAHEGDGPVGTVGYISPEELRGEPTTPASDLYALGVMLYEIVAGRPVFEGSPFAVLRAHLEREAPRLSDVAWGVPEAVVEACAGLLAKSPAARPSLDELARALLEPIGAAPPDVSTRLPMRTEQEEPLGRDAEKRALADALARAEARRFAWVAVVGPSGSGKTTLVDWATKDAERRGATLLAGRGRPTERVPFNAVDGAVDDLAIVARRRIGSGLEDPAFATAIACAASAFPVLASCAPRQARVPVDAPRVLVFDAFTRAVTIAAEVSPVVLVVDDLQWADADSCAILEHLVDASPPGVCVIATLRDDVEPPPKARALLAREETCLIALGPLDDDALGAIVAKVAKDDGGDLGPDTVKRAVLACAGRPFLAEMTGRALARDRDAATSERSITMAMLGPALEGRRPLLTLLVAADDWVLVGALAEITREALGATEDALRELARAGVVRCAGESGPAGRAALYHDVVRTAALSVLEPKALVAAHGELADWLGARPDAPPEKLVVHLLGAGRAREAATHARRAATRAEEQRAYALAAEMYALATEDPLADRVELLCLRAIALERAAQYADAAVCWRSVASASVGEVALDARLREASALVACHDLAAGTRRLRDALASAGLPPVSRSRLTDVLTVARFVVGPLPELRRSRSPVASPEAVARCERNLNVAAIVAYLDPLAGTRLLQRASAEATNRGAHEIAAWCDWIFAYYALFLNASRGRVPLADRYIASARARLVGRAPSERVRTMAAFLEGAVAEREAAWDRAIDAYDRAVANAETIGYGTNEHALTLMNRAQVELFRQSFGSLDVSLRRMRTVAKNSPQTNLVTYADIVETFAMVYKGKTADARAISAAVLRRLDAGGQNRLGHATRLFGYVIDLHDYRPSAHVDFARDLEAARRFGALRYMRTGAILAMGAVLEANALRRGERSASGRRVEALARASLRAPPYLVGGAFRALAYAKDAEGDPARACTLLARAEREATSYEQPVEAAIARYQLGVRIGGDRGRALVARAREAVTGAGASESVLHEDAGRR